MPQYDSRIAGNHRYTGDIRVDGEFEVPNATFTISRSRIVQDTGAYIVPPTDLRVHDALGTPISAAGNDDLGLTPGTFGSASPVVTAGDVKGLGAVTRYARFLFALPPEYVAGGAVTIRAYAATETTIADTSCTLDAEAYLSDDEGGVGSDLVTTAAQSINSTTFADTDFTVTPTSLEPGDVLDIRIAIAANDGATGTAVTPTIGKLSVRCLVKG